MQGPARKRKTPGAVHRTHPIKGNRDCLKIECSQRRMAINGQDLRRTTKLQWTQGVAQLAVGKRRAETEAEAEAGVEDEDEEEGGGVLMIRLDSLWVQLGRGVGGETRKAPRPLCMWLYVCMAMSSVTDAMSHMQPGICWCPQQKSFSWFRPRTPHSLSRSLVGVVFMYSLWVCCHGSAGAEKPRVAVQAWASFGGTAGIAEISRSGQANIAKASQVRIKRQISWLLGKLDTANGHVRSSSGAKASHCKRESVEGAEPAYTAQSES